MIRVRHCIKKSQRGLYGEEALKAAIDAIRDGRGINATLCQFGIPTKTLCRHLDGWVSVPGQLNLRSKTTVFLGNRNWNLLIIYMLRKSFVWIKYKQSSYHCFWTKHLSGNRRSSWIKNQSVGELGLAMFCLVIRTVRFNYISTGK